VCNDVEKLASSMKAVDFMAQVREQAIYTLPTTGCIHSQSDRL